MAEARAQAQGRPGGGTPAVQALRRLEVAFALHAYPFGGGAGIALEAAEALGVAPARILKTLMATVDGRSPTSPFMTWCCRWWARSRSR